MSLFADPESLWNDDGALISMANRKRILLNDSPTQSGFRVFCILVVESDGKIQFIEGTNSEQGYIGGFCLFLDIYYHLLGAICAERAALVQLRLLPNPIIKKVVIVTDSTSPIAPGEIGLIILHYSLSLGALCREYLMSHAHPDTDVIIASCCGEKIMKCKLGELYPHPYQYRSMKRYELLNYASIYSSTLSHDVTLCHEQIHSLHRSALEVISNDKLDVIHPIKFAAAVLYKNNDIEATWFLKAFEYGDSLDPVSQLVVLMEKRKHENRLKKKQQTLDDGDSSEWSKYDENYSIPHIILMTDQFGVCHAPFAPARTLLKEHGYEDVLVVVHHHPTVCYQTCRASELLPVPEGIESLSHDDFMLVTQDP